MIAKDTTRPGFSISWGKLCCSQIVALWMHWTHSPPSSFAALRFWGIAPIAGDVLHFYNFEYKSSLEPISLTVAHQIVSRLRPVNHPCSCVRFLGTPFPLSLSVRGC